MLGVTSLRWWSALTLQKYQLVTELPKADGGSRVHPDDGSVEHDLPSASHGSPLQHHIFLLAEVISMKKRGAAGGNHSRIRGMAYWPFLCLMGSTSPYIVAFNCWKSFHHSIMPWICAETIKLARSAAVTLGRDGPATTERHRVTDMLTRRVTGEQAGAGTQHMHQEFEGGAK